MIYKCNACHFLFSRAGEVERCPDCGSFNFIAGNDTDTQEYQRLRREFTSPAAEDEYAQTITFTPSGPKVMLDGCAERICDIVLKLSEPTS